MDSPPANKRGRKEKPYQLANGQYVNGLRRRPDGRWVVVSTGKMFTEPDESKAIKRFQELVGTNETAEEADERMYRGQQLHITKKQMWRYFADELQANPKKVAELTGLPTLQWFKSYHAPEELPSLETIKKHWMDNATCGNEQKRKVAGYWQTFVDFTKIKGIDEITPQLALDYQDYIYSEGYAPKMQQHYFNATRAILRVKRTQIMAMEAINKTIINLKLMTPNGVASNNDPHPISVADWKKFLAVVAGDNKAMLICMLNCCLYLGEVVTMQWSEIKDDGTYVSRRKKRGQHIRVATLWPETIEALNAIEKKGPNIFRSNQGNQLSKFTAFERFREWRDDAKVKGVTASHIRDGAYSAAVAANVSLALCQILAGHSIGGQADNYVLGDAKAVAPACNAIYDKYMR